MTKNFSWEPFSVQFIKSICYSEKTKKSLRPDYDSDFKDGLLTFMDRISLLPTEQFIRRYHNEIIDNFLANSTHLVSIVKALAKINYRGVNLGSMQDMLAQIKRLKMTSTVIMLIQKELYAEGRKFNSDDFEMSIFTKLKKIDLAACIPDDLQMRDYQKQAIESLNKYFLEENGKSGILAMPTGSGKTRVATKFLLESMVANGWQVIWLTHRSMLIEQTASSIYNAAGALLKRAVPEKETFKMVCVSGSHASAKATEPDDDVMICSVQSLVRNLPFLHAVLGKKVMIIVDEAHHAIAPSYRTVINEIRKISSEVKLLGLTATPVRIRDEDTKKLMTMFDNKIIYSVSMSTLITEKHLSDPKFERVETNIDFDTTITLDEKEYIKKWGEVSPETMEKMAQIAERNALIADTYMKDKERYGKTLIFAVNATHCISLCEELQKRGVKCDYIYCAHSGNEEKIARFKRGEIDVLVNIQVLTEGSDVPDIQTVFLTRPTASDVLLMQMIGRGMRGPDSGGTETVNIVDFHDVWGNFVNWLNPEFIFGFAKAEDEAAEYIAKPQNTVPWQMIRDLLDGIQTKILSNGIPHCATLPVGWYDVIDEDGNDTKVLVFESQLAGYIKMLKKENGVLNNPDFTGTMGVRKFFGAFGLVPSAHDIQMVLDTYRISGEFPVLRHFKERNAVDAAVLAEKINEENVGILDLDNRISTAYSENEGIINSLYGDLDAYKTRVKNFLMYPKGIKPLGMRIEEVPEESIPLDTTPFYDLNELLNEVNNEMFDGAYGKLPFIKWTDVYYSSYFGVYKYFPNPDDNYIEINRILNSKDVPREAVKYVIYHELIHRDIKGHGPAFRSVEHEYPNWTDHERFLDFTFPKYDID